MFRGRPKTAIVAAATALFLGLGALIFYDASKHYAIGTRALGVLGQVRGWSPAVGCPEECSPERVSARARASRRMKGVAPELSGAELWQAIEQCKQRLPKDWALQRMSLQRMKDDIPVWVMSLKRSKDRHAHMQSVLRKAGANFTFVDAFDAIDPLTVKPDVVDYFWNGSGWNEWWRNGDKVAKGKLAADLTLRKLYQQVVFRNKPAIILEDDVAPAYKTDWLSEIHTTLQDLPADWDVLFLNACFEEVGAGITERVKVLRSAACLAGIVASPRFAVLALANSEARHWAPLDTMLGWMMKNHLLQAYIAQPRLLSFVNFGSIIQG